MRKFAHIFYFMIKGNPKSILLQINKKYKKTVFNFSVNEKILDYLTDVADDNLINRGKAIESIIVEWLFRNDKNFRRFCKKEKFYVPKNKSPL